MPATNRRDHLNHVAEWMTHTISSIGDGVIATSCSGAILFMNPLAEEITGWALENALGQPASRVLPIYSAQSRQEIPNPLREAFIEEQVARNAERCLLKTAGGKLVGIDYTAAPILNGDNEAIGAVIVIRPASARETPRRAFRARAETPLGKLA